MLNLKSTSILFIFFISLFVLNTNSIAEKESKEVAAETKEVVSENLLETELKPGEIFNCEADIYYEWETIPEPPAPKDPKDTSATPQVLPIKQKQFVETLVERRLDGELGKSRLESRLIEAKSRAISLCKSDHDTNECKTQKIANAKKDLQVLDFQTKRALISSLMDACEDKAGKCLEASSSEIRCQIYRSPDAPVIKKVEAAATPAKK